MSRSRKPLEPPSQPCGATTRKDPETGERRQCKNLAIRGATVCRMHGANKKVRANADRRVEVYVQEAKLAQFLQTNGYEPVENPLEALRDLAGEIVAVKNWLRDQVTHLDHESSVQGEQISALMQLYSNFLDKADRTLTNIAKLNIDERLAHIEQAKAQVMVLVMVEAINRLMPGQPAKQNQAKALVGQLLERYDR